MFQSIKEWDKKIMTTADPALVFCYERAERAEYAIEAIRSIIKNECKVYPGDKFDEYESYLEIINNGGIPYATLGVIEGKHFFLNRSLLYRRIRIELDKKDIDLNAPKYFLFRDLMKAKVLIPSKSLWDKTAFCLEVNGEKDKYVCISNNVLKIDLAGLNVA
jgi:hypothetical protein